MVLTGCGDHFARLPAQDIPAGFTQVGVSVNNPAALTPFDLPNLSVDPIYAMPTTAGSMMFYITDQSNPDLQRIEEVSYSASTSSVSYSTVLPNGNYTIAAITYDATGAGFASTSGLKSMYCGAATSGGNFIVGVNGSTLSINISLSTANCNASPFMNDATNTTLSFKYCENLNSGSTGSDMSYTSEITAGSYACPNSTHIGGPDLTTLTTGSMKFTYLIRDSITSSTDPFSGTTAFFLTNCQPVTNGVATFSSTTAKAFAYGDPNLINTNSTGAFRFPVKLIAIQAAGCSGANRNYQFPVGLAAASLTTSTSTTTVSPSPAPVPVPANNNTLANYLFNTTHYVFIRSVP